MANVVDLLITARDNARTVLKGVDAQAAALGKTFGTTGSAVEGALARVQNALGATALSLSTPVVAAGVFAAGVAAVAVVAQGATARLASMAQAAEDVVNQAARVAGSASLLSGIRAVMDDAGIASEGLGRSLKFLAQAIDDGDPLLRKYGITSRDTTTALLQFADGAGRARDANELIADATKLLGREGQAMIPILLRGGEAIRSQIGSYREWGTVLDDVRIKRLAAYDDTIDEVRARMDGLRNQLLVRVLPAFEALGGVLITALDQLNKIPSAFERIGTAARDAINRFPGGKQALDALAIANALGRAADAQERLKRAGTTAIGTSRSDFAGPPEPGTPKARPEITEDQLKALERLAAISRSIAEAVSKVPADTRSDVLGREAARLDKGKLTPEQQAFQNVIDSLKIVNKDSLDALAASVQSVATSAPQLTQAGTALRDFPLNIGTLTESLERDLPRSITTTLDQVLAGTESFGSALTSLWSNILNDIKHALVDSFVESSGIKSLIKRGVGAIVGFITGGPAGAVAGFAGSDVTFDGGQPLALAGRGSAPSIVLNVNGAVDAASFFESSTGINGRIRQAIDRAARLADA